MVERVKARAVDYTTSAETLASQDAEADRLVQEFRNRVKQEHEEAESGNTGQSPNHQGPKQGRGPGSNSGKGKNRRQRRRSQTDPDPEPNPSVGEGE